MLRRRLGFGLTLATLLLLTGCLDSLLSQTGLLVTGEPFIISGTAAVDDDKGPCVMWVGNNGVKYYLFQGARVLNEDFDRVTTPGVTSRLEIATRSDLVAKCNTGTIVEVQRVLEIVEN